MPGGKPKAHGLVKAITEFAFCGTLRYLNLDKAFVQMILLNQFVMRLPPPVFENGTDSPMEEAGR